MFQKNGGKSVSEKVGFSKSDKIVMIIFFVLFIFYSVSLLFPFGWCLMNSFKTRKDFFININGLPKEWTTENWIKSFSLSADRVPLPMMYFNSIFLTVGATFFSIMSCSATAYTVTKYKFPGRDLIYSTAVIVMMIPLMGSMASTYKLYNTIGLINTYTGYFLFSLGGFGSFFLILYSFYKNLSLTYAEAAQIDGAGHFKIYLTIMLPMAVPVLSSLSVLAAIGYWNDYFTIYMYLPEKATIAYGIQRIADLNKNNLPQVFAAMIFSMLPILVIFGIFQKPIMNNTTIGGIKG